MSNNIYLELKNISEYNNIKNIMKETRRRNSICIYTNNLNFEDLCKKAKEQNLEKIREFEEQELVLLYRLIECIENNNYKGLDAFFENVVDDTKIKILDYIYWQYKDKNNPIKINIGEIKKILKYKIGGYIRPIKFKAKCNVCNGEGIFYVYSYTDKSRVKFECKQCGHIIKAEQDTIFPGICECSKCKENAINAFLIIKNNFNILIQKLQNKVLDEYKKIEITQSPDDKEMLLDYEMFRSNFDKDIQEVFRYKPKNITDLETIINKLDERNGMYYSKTHKRYKDMIINKLKKVKVIYEVQYKNDINIIEDMILENTTRLFYDNNLQVNIVSSILEFLNNCKDYEEFCKVVKWYSQCDRLIFDIGYKRIEFNMWDNDKNYIDFSRMIREDFIINKYYFQDKKESVPDIDNTQFFNCIYNSNAEASLHMNISDKYLDSHVMVNVRAKTFIKENIIQTLVTPETYEYYKVCIFDFVIYNYKGYPTKIIELQRGKHHNEIEWIKKDKMKKDICKSVGLEFEEVF